MCDTHPDDRKNAKDASKEMTFVDVCDHERTLYWAVRITFIVIDMVILENKAQLGGGIVPDEFLPPVTT